MKNKFVCSFVIFVVATTFCGAALACEQGTTLCAGITANPYHQVKYNWEIDKTATPTELNLDQGETGTSHCIVSLTKDSGTKTAWIEGYVTVTNKGDVATKDLSVKVKLATASGTGITSANVDISSHPVLQPGESHKYYYRISIPAAYISSGRNFKVSSDVTVTNYSGHLGTPYGPSSSYTAKLPEPELINEEVHVLDSNGMSWTCDKSELEEYDEEFCCNGNPHLTYVNTATIQETGQSAEVTIAVNWIDPSVEDPIIIGDNSSVLSPSQNQTQDQAQAQAQTSNNTNNNSLNNTNTNTANSSSNANNNINIVNTNTFNPFVYLLSENKIRDICVSPSNINSQLQAKMLRYPFVFGEGTLIFCGAGGVPQIMASVPSQPSQVSPQGVGMEEAGLNVTSLLMGIVGVLGGLLASRYSS